MFRPVEESVDEDVIVPGISPGTAPIVERIIEWRYNHCEAFSYRGLRASTTTARYQICLRTLPGSIPGTDRATRIDSACKIAASSPQQNKLNVVSNTKVSSSIIVTGQLHSVRVLSLDIVPRAIVCSSMCYIQFSITRLRFSFPS